MPLGGRVLPLLPGQRDFYGLRTGQPLILAFSIIGVLNGSGQQHHWLRPTTVPMHWCAHMGNMLGGCVATITALILFVARHTGYSGDSLLLWVARPRSAGTLAQSIEQGSQVVWNWRFEPQGLPVRRMPKAKPIGMQGMAGKRDRSKVVRAKHIPPLADERVPAQPRLDPDLVSLARFEPHFDE